MRQIGKGRGGCPKTVAPYTQGKKKRGVNEPFVKAMNRKRERRGKSGKRGGLKTMSSGVKKERERVGEKHIRRVAPIRGRKSEEG